MVYPPPPNSAKTSGHVELAQKYLQLKSRSGHLSPKPEMSSTSLKFHVSRLRGSPGRPDTSLTGFSSPKLFGSSSEHRLTTSSYIVEEANSEEIRPTPSKSTSKFDWSDFNNPKKFELKEIKERSGLATASSMVKSRREYYPYGEKPLTLEDLYTDAKDVGEELKTIIAQEHEETIKGLMKHLNVREFMKIQKSRIENVLKVVEKGFVQKVAKENKVKQETWNVISAELNEVRSVYEEFLLTLEGEYDKAIKGKKKLDDSLVPWEALRMLIEYSPLYRASKNEPSQGAQSKLDDLFRAIHRFKVEYRISRDFKPKVLEIYGQVEAHIKSLNELIDNERAKAAGIVQQRKQLLQERKEIEEKNDKLKNEMMETIKEWKMSGSQAQKHNLPAFQEKYLQGKIDQLQAEFDKATSDNTQLIKDLKETRQEVRRLAYREDRMSKNCKDKAIMVDLYTKESLGPPTILMTSYLTDIELCKDGSELPKELINSLTSLIYSDKMIADLCDDHDMRPRRSLGAYLPEWFLKKFGVYGFSEMLLRDFMCNVNTIAKNSDKFKVFRELVGVEAYSGLDSFKYMLDGHNKPEKTRLKKIAFCTAEMSRQFNRIINCVKHHWQLEIDSPVHSHNHGPYLPNIPPKKEYISNETIKSVLLAIITEEKFNDNEVKDIEEFLFLTQQAEAYNRELNTKVTNNDEPEAPPIGMKFDLFVKFLLEIILQKHMEKLEVYYTTFKAKMAAVKQKALSFEEYKQTIEHIDPEASQSWKEHSYAQLMNQYSSQKVPLLKLMENFIKCYFKEDQAKEIHHKPHHEKYKKKETSSLKIGKNNSSKQNSSTKKHQKHTEQNDSNSVKPRLLESAKEAFGLGEPYLNEQGYELYDAISSLIVLQETYYMLEERVTLIEKSTDGLLGAHDDFSKSLALLPKKISKLDKYDSLVIFSKEELVDFVEQLWIKFRIILSLAFRSK